MDTLSRRIVPPGLLKPESAEQIERVAAAALAVVEPRRAVRRALDELNSHWETASRVRLVAVGKAALAMAAGAVDVLGERLADGLVITKHVLAGHTELPASIGVLVGDHPLPGQQSLSSTRALVEFLSRGREGDCIICLVSGGGSALMTLPVDGVRLEELQQLTALLLASGATIHEMNCLRKHLDRVKGGGLARLFSPARAVALIISDVVGSPLEVIASGPTVADPSTYADALAVLEKYDLLERAPARVVAALRQGRSGALPETLKPGNPLLGVVQNHLILSNRHAADAAIQAARAAGFHTLLLTTYLQGEAAQAGAVLAALLQEIAASGQPLARPACIVAGGETTVTLRGSGRGGRNQELALGAVTGLDGLPDVALLALATDGEDGPTDAAGALVTGQTAQRARAARLSPAAALRENNSYAFFASLDALVKIGPTGTNVNDLTLLFAFDTAYSSTPP